MKMGNYFCCYTFAEKFLSPHSLQMTYKMVVDEAVALVGGKYGYIFLFSNGRMQRIYSSNKLLYSIVPRKNGVTMEVYTTKKPIIRTIKDIEKIMPDSHPTYSMLAVRYDINIPLVYHKKIFGVLSILGEKKFGENDISTLLSFSPLATLSIQESQTREKLRQAISSRDLFLSLAAHELKTPLTSISLYSDMLINKTPADLTTQKLNTSIKRLKHLTNGLLDMNRIKRGTMKFDMQEVHLNSLITYAVGLFQDINKNFPISMESNLKQHEDMITGDWNKLVQMLTNIFDNAIKYSDENDGVHIALKRNKNQAAIIIADHGIGIPSKELPKIFNQYFQAGVLKQEGLGIGLYLAKYITNNHHGTIHADSTTGKGTTITITLPLNT